MDYCRQHSEKFGGSLDVFTCSSKGTESKHKPVIVLKRQSRQEVKSDKEEVKQEEDPFVVPTQTKSPKAKTAQKTSPERQKAQILLNNVKYNHGLSQ